MLIRHCMPLFQDTYTCPLARNKNVHNVLSLIIIKYNTIKYYTKYEVGSTCLIY